MEVCDFSRSFVTFVTHGRGNNARIQVEARCELSREGSDVREQYLLVASCKSEDTFAARHLFKVPNYDFCAIFGGHDYRIIRTHVPYQAAAGEIGANAERFEAVHMDVVMTDEGERCESNEAIVQASLQNRPLVARTEIHSKNDSRRAVLEYPIKTMNANDIRNVYQVDTGPIALPNLEAAGKPIEHFELAFVAFNTPDWAEFVVQVPALVPEGNEHAKPVMHYSDIRVLPARNEIISVG